jgi:hypothetical protein
MNLALRAEWVEKRKVTSRPADDTANKFGWANLRPGPIYGPVMSQASVNLFPDGLAHRQTFKRHGGILNNIEEIYLLQWALEVASAQPQFEAAQRAQEVDIAIEDWSPKERRERKLLASNNAAFKFTAAFKENPQFGILCEDRMNRPLARRQAEFETLFKIINRGGGGSSLRFAARRSLGLNARPAPSCPTRSGRWAFT